MFKTRSIIRQDLREGVMRMPRPTKCRKVCHFPKNLEFIPAEKSDEREPIKITLDEYETIRLMDLEKFSQEQCSKFMQVARTTVQRIYESAREKMAQALVEGRPFVIEGGEIWLCDGDNTSCNLENCYKRQFQRNFSKPEGEHMMRVAVTYEEGEIFQHFGHTSQFKVYDIEDGTVVDSQVVDTNGSGHGALAGVLTALNADVLICGGIGGGAQMALKAAGIQLFGGVSGMADDAVNAFLLGKLNYNPDVQCSHHDGHHGKDHVCGDHGCGEHSCH